MATGCLNVFGMAAAVDGACRTCRPSGAFLGFPDFTAFSQERAEWCLVSGMALPGDPDLAGRRPAGSRWLLAKQRQPRSPGVQPAAAPRHPAYGVRQSRLEQIQHGDSVGGGKLNFLDTHQIRIEITLAFR